MRLNEISYQPQLHTIVADFHICNTELVEHTRVKHSGRLWDFKVNQQGSVLQNLNSVAGNTSSHGHHSDQDAKDTHNIN